MPSTAATRATARRAPPDKQPVVSSDHFVTAFTLATVLERMLEHMTLPKAEADKLRRHLRTLAQQHSRPLASGDRLLRAGDLRHKIGGASPKLLQRCMDDPSFPAPVALPSCEEGREPQRRWRESDVDAWLAQRPPHEGQSYDNTPHLPK